MQIWSKLWMNGEFISYENAKISVSSHSLHYGYGIFDGIMAYWDKETNSYILFEGHAHFDRFIKSANFLGFEIPQTPIELEKITYNLLSSTLAKKDYYVRPIIFRSTSHIPLTGKSTLGKGDIAIMLMEVPNFLLKEISLIFSSYERVKGKSLPVQAKICAAYSNSFLVRHEAEEKGYNDGIMLNSNGLICEASAANIFFIKDNKLYTPSINHDIFPGITRSVIIEIASDNNIEVNEIDIHHSSIHKYEACFLCATLMGLVPVERIQNVQFKSIANITFKFLHSELKNRIYSM